MRYRLRSLLIVLTVMPPFLATGYFGVKKLMAKPPTFRTYSYKDKDFILNLGPPPPGTHWKLTKDGAVAEYSP